MPQASVLGPLLFIIFISDLEDKVRNKLLKFAGDTKVFGKVNSAADALQLQDNLNQLFKWANNQQMDFNVEKFVIMHI